MKVFSQDQPKNVIAFLALLQYTEGTDKYANPYTTRYTGLQVQPNQPHDGKAVTANGLSSTAIGAYQFLYRTWRDIHAGSNPPMTPRAQDLAAIALIKRRGAYNDVLAGNWAAAIEKTNKEWASLPGSPYGQPTKSMKKVLDFLTKFSTGAGVAIVIFLAGVFFC